jgi:hypothetical protein
LACTLAGHGSVNRACCLKILIEGGKFQVLRLNDTSHLIP